jgi:hypothetical protein
MITGDSSPWLNTASERLKQQTQLPREKELIEVDLQIVVQYGM